MSQTSLPKVTPYLIDRAADLCPRRLRLHHQNQRGDTGAFLRGRVRDALVSDARAAHADMGPPNPGSFFVRPELLPEEQAVQRRAIDHYLELFADEAVRSIDHEEYERPVERQGVLIGGWVDVVCEGPTGDPELRQFELWGRPLDPDPVTNPAVHLAVLRLARWIGERTIRVRHADLVAGRLEECSIDLSADRGHLVSLYEQRLARIRLRTKEPQAVPGETCTACPFVPGCPAFK